MKTKHIAVVLLALVILLTSVAAFYPDGGKAMHKGDCVEVLKDSVHGYYSPEFESALVGWFVEGEELSFRHADGDWWMVAGKGIDSALHHTRMTAWVHSSYMGVCQ